MSNSDPLCMYNFYSRTNQQRQSWTMQTLTIKISTTTVLWIIRRFRKKITIKMRRRKQEIQPSSLRCFKCLKIFSYNPCNWKLVIIISFKYHGKMCGVFYFSSVCIYVCFMCTVAEYYKIYITYTFMYNK